MRWRLPSPPGTHPNLLSHARRMFLSADGEAGKEWGNETIRVAPHHRRDCVVTIRLPTPLAHLSNTVGQMPSDGCQRRDSGRTHTGCSRQPGREAHQTAYPPARPGVDLEMLGRSHSSPGAGPVVTGRRELGHKGTNQHQIGAVGHPLGDHTTAKDDPPLAFGWAVRAEMETGQLADTAMGTSDVPSEAVGVTLSVEMVMPCLIADTNGDVTVDGDDRTAYWGFPLAVGRGRRCVSGSLRGGVES